jgi:cytochrome c556
MRTGHWLFIVSAALFVFGIGFLVVGAHYARQTPTAEVQTAVEPIASVKQIMSAIVTPASAVVYQSVGTVISAKGIEETAPKDDDEWAAVGSNAAALAEAGNLMMLEGRAVDRGDWIKMAQAMVDAAKTTLKAVEAKSADGVLAAGAELNMTCDNCHQRYSRQ